MSPAVSDRSYQAALDALARALVFGMHPSLKGIRVLTDELGRPQDAFASAQVTGTNGKTSTARFTEALLRGEGIRTGLYTSPHLERYPERIEIGGRPLTDAEFAEAVHAALDAAESLRPGEQGTPEGFTEFELLTAAALWAFRAHGVEYAVLEVGLGGTWDSTSIVDPSVSVITGVGLDHVGVLGDTLERIAAEKAGIIKPASAPVLGPGTAGLEYVFLAAAEKAHTQARAVRRSSQVTPVDEALTVRFDVVRHPSEPGGTTVLDVRGVHGGYPGLEVAAPGYQADNAATAIAAAEAALGRALDPSAAGRALGSVTLPGRFETARREPNVVVVDGSHNPQAAAVLAGAISEAWPEPASRPSVLLGVLADKDAAGIVAALTPVANGFAVCAPQSPRALSAEALASVVTEVVGERPSTFATVPEALAALLGEGGSPLVVTGSLTTAGEARAWLRDSSATAD